MSHPLYPAGKLPHADLSSLLSQYTHSHPRVIVPPALGEDATVLDFGDRYLVAKTDPITFATDAVGWYAVHVNANDIAAMGATPQFFLSTILLPAPQATAELAESIFRSIYAAADSLAIAVCGGHTEITHAIDHPIVVGQMLGEVAPGDLVRSSGLRPGDHLLLSKSMGIEATAIIAREKRADLVHRGYSEGFIERCAAFLTDPGISVVRDARIATAAAKVTAMHDPTEGGVATALYELAAASDVGLEIDGDALLLADETRQLCTAYNLDPFGIISSGALLIGCDAENSAAILSALHEAGLAATCIGRAREKTFGLHIRRGDDLQPLPHFTADEIVRLFVD